MDEFPNPHDDTAPSILERIEAMEPYVAIRLMILQLAAAVAIGFVASREIDMSNAGLGEFSDPGAMFDLNAITPFGYPIRELVWSGEWWRILTGLFLPPQWMLWGIACVGLFPFARYLESRIGRIRSSLVYLLGAVTVIYLDLLGFPGVTSGALGMVMAAGGATWVLLRIDGLRIFMSGTDIPGASWFVLFTIVPFAWIHSFQHNLLQGTAATMTPLVPSWISLLAAAFTGMVTVLPLRDGAIESGSPDEATSQGGLRRPQILWAVAGFWGVTVASYGFMTWFADYRLDYRIWKLEPGIQQGDSGSLAEMRLLSDRNPRQPFPKKRLLIHHLRNEDWESSKLLFSEIPADSTNSQDLGTIPQRGGRYSLLNLRGPGRWQSWRFSGDSANYDTDKIRLLLDRAHMARLSGDDDGLSSFRDEILSEYSLMFEELIAGIHKKVEENEALRERNPTSEEQYRIARLRAQQLNSEAYTLAELEGDLGEALVKAQEAVRVINDPQILDTLGWIEVLNGDYEKGIKSLEDALFAPGLKPSGTIYYHLGVAYEEARKLDRAKELYAKALQSDLEWWEELDLKKRCLPCFQESISN